MAACFPELAAVTRVGGDGVRLRTVCVADVAGHFCPLLRVSSAAMRSRVAWTAASWRSSLSLSESIVFWLTVIVRLLYVVPRIVALAIGPFFVAVSA